VDLRGYAGGDGMVPYYGNPEERVTRMIAVRGTEEANAEDTEVRGGKTNAMDAMEAQCSQWDV
jgi:hypothetical protein